MATLSVVAVERGDSLITDLGSDFLFEARDTVYVRGSSEDTEAVEARKAVA